MSASSSATVSPSTKVNDNDHGALVTVAAALCITASLTFHIARGIVRWPWRTLVGSDDLAASAALFFAMIQVIVSCVAANHGLGRNQNDMTSNELSSVATIVYACNIFFVASLCLGKLSVALLLRRLASSDNAIRLASAGCWACGVYGLVSLLTIATYTPSNLSGGHQMARWVAVGVLSDVVDVCIIAFPFYLVRGLQMQAQTRFTVVSGFGMRFPVVIFSIVRLVMLSRSLWSHDVNFAYANTEIWTQFEMNFNLIAATIPCLRIFLRAFHSGRLGGSVEEVDPMDSRFATKGSGTRTWNGGTKRDATRQGSVPKEAITQQQAEDGGKPQDPCALPVLIAEMEQQAPGGDDVLGASPGKIRHQAGRATYSGTP